MFAKSLTLVIAALAFACQTATSQPIPTTQPALAYNFTTAIPLGTHIGDHVFQNNVQLSGPAAFNDDGLVALSGQWVGAAIGGANTRGVFTSTRVVVEEGSKIGDSLIVGIVNVRPGDLQINSRGQVAYLATIDSKACINATSCTGLFVDRDLRAVTAIPNATYVLTDDGKIQSSSAGFWMKPTRGQAGSSIFSKFGGTIRMAARTIDVPLLGPIWVNPDAIKLGQTPQTNTGNQNAGFTAPTAYPTCTSPGGDFTSPWSGNANGAGPITSSFPQVSSSTTYRPMHGEATRYWERTIFFSQDCRPIAVALKQISSPAVDEIWTPAGLLTAFDPSAGSYQLGAMGNAALPPRSSGIESVMRVNRRCQVLIPATLRSVSGEQSALVLATPSTPGHCQ